VAVGEFQSGLGNRVPFTHTAGTPMKGSTMTSKGKTKRHAVSPSKKKTQPRFGNPSESDKEPTGDNGESESHMDEPPTQAALQDGHARARLCINEIQEVLQRHNCVLLPQISEPEYVGDSRSKVMFGSTWGVHPLPPQR